MKDLLERTELKKKYIGEWLKFKEDHPGMPLRIQFGHGAFSKKNYRLAKDEWNKRNSDISGYLFERFNYFLSKLNGELAGLYSINYPEIILKK